MGDDQGAAGPSGAELLVLVILIGGEADEVARADVDRSRRRSHADPALMQVKMLSRAGWVRRGVLDVPVAKGEVEDLGRVAVTVERCQQPRLHGGAGDRCAAAAAYHSRRCGGRRRGDEVGERRVKRVGQCVEGLERRIPAAGLKLGERGPGRARAAGQLHK